jgi:hypothetical protein
LVFIETSIFTSAIKSLLIDEEYLALQWSLVRNPKKGVLILAGGGLRKVRWVSRQRRKGKRGGIRIIYYIQSNDTLYMIFAYDKNRQKDLSREQLKHLQTYVKLGVL